MANFFLDGASEFADELMNLGKDVDEMAMQIVDEAADIMDEKLREGIRRRTSRYGTGTLAESIHHNKPRKNALGIFTASTARGKDTKKGKHGKKGHAAYNKKTGAYVGHRKSYGSGAIDNADKLYFLEYGNSRQPATPIIQSCVNEAEPAVLEKMQAAYDRLTEDK